MSRIQEIRRQIAEHERKKQEQAPEDDYCESPDVQGGRLTAEHWTQAPDYYSMDTSYLGLHSEQELQRAQQRRDQARDEELKIIPKTDLDINWHDNLPNIDPTKYNRIMIKSWDLGEGTGTVIRFQKDLTGSVRGLDYRITLNTKRGSLWPEADRLKDYVKTALFCSSNQADNNFEIYTGSTSDGLIQVIIGTQNRKPVQAWIVLQDAYCYQIVNSWKTKLNTNNPGHSIDNHVLYPTPVLSIADACEVAWPR